MERILGMPTVGLTAILIAASATFASAAGQDVAGSRDPYGLERYPRTWIVTYEVDDEIRPRELVTSRVDRIRRDLRVDDVVRLDGTAEAVTYQAPDGVTVEDLDAHFRERLAGEVLFRCEGPGCGRSADWANQIFGQSILYGPDRNQRYTALEWRGRLVSLYVIERGNKRVYAHLRFFEREDDLDGDPHALAARRLTERGWIVVEGVEPGADGAIGASARSALMDLGARLDGLAGERVYLVCHLYGAFGTDALLAASRRCAEEAARIMAEAAEGTEGGQGPEVEPFGAGPLLPRPGPPGSRLELVLPAATRAAP
jgi:hypothetical protein